MNHPRGTTHITLTTGHSRQSLRGEISAAAIAICRDLIDRITVGEVSEPVKIPNVGDYYLSGRASGACLVATVLSGAPSEVIATLGVAANNLGAADLWKQMHQSGVMPIVTRADHLPSSPWIAAKLEVGIARHIKAADWLGDFERCLAWAWIERVGLAVDSR